MDYLWMGVAYLGGTFFTLWWLGPQIAEKSIGKTIDSLIAQGFLKYKKDDKGEIEILKWNDYQN